jgi:hypothetical protein
MIIAWISSRYECWDQSSFSLILIEKNMDHHQYGHANSWFLISYSFWLDIPNTHFNLYLHTSSLINSMQSDFLNLYSYKQTKVETVTAKIRTSDRETRTSDFHRIQLWAVSFVIWPLLGMSSLMRPWFILQSLIKASPLSNSSCSCKASHYRDQFKIINLCLICHLPNMLAFTWWYDIPQYRGHFMDSICIVVFCLN